MRISLFTLALASSLPVLAADPPSKRSGGLFNFRSPSREQISAGLFPDARPSSAPTSSGGASPTQSPRASDDIFRGQGPQKIEPVSYVIENGRRVEKPLPTSLTPKKQEESASTQPLSAPAAPIPAEAVNSGEKKRGGFFGFGKRGEDSPEANPVVPPVPVAAPTPPSAVPLAPAKPSPVPDPTPSNETPSFAETKEEKGKGSWIPFLNRKKAEAPVAADPLAAVPVAEEASAPAPAPVVAKPTPKPAAAPSQKPASPEVATFEIRRDESKPVENKPEKANRESGLLAPIAKIRPPRKEIDLSGAETIIQNGEIVGESESTFTTSSASPSGPRQAPQVVNGVKTYSSWNDVDARSSSAADKIINRIR